MRSLQKYLVIHRRQARRTRRQHALRSIFSRLALGIGALLSLALVAAAGLGAFAYTGLTQSLPSIAALPELLNPPDGTLLQPTRLYDRSGQYLIYSLENPGIPRRYLYVDPANPDHVSTYLVQATIAILDPDFWRSPGFSFADLNSPQPHTIAERLVDDLLLWNEKDDPQRRMRLRLLAAQVVSQYGRSQTLEWYLNSAWFGHLAYGAESAARLYFGKSAAELDLAESAVLVGVLETPALNPLDAPAAALERKADILQRLFDSGAINAEDFQRAMQKEIVFAPHPEQPVEPALAFSRLVIDQLSQQFGARRVEHGGLRVVTTLDYDLQLQTGCALQTQLARLEGETTPAAGTCLSARYLSALPGSSNLPPTGVIASAVLLDVESGEVLAFIGNSTRLGETVQVKGHSPGSVLTPFVALSAFTYDYSPSSLLWDIPSNLPTGLEDKLNPDGKFRGPLRLRMAVANDVLAPLASLVSQLGSQNVWHLARAFGFNSLGEEAIPGELLFGGGDVSLLEVAQAYNTIANQGIQPGVSTSDSASLQPVTVLLVEETNGATWIEHLIPKSQVVISSQIAYLTHHVLSDDTARRISLGYPNSFDIGRPVGAKAAQAENGAQVWAVGYTPQRLAVAWFGLPQEAGESARLDVKVPAGVWHALIQYASRDLPVMGWTAPAGISTLLVCDPSGLLPSRDCPTVVSEIFQIGSEPLAADNLYRAFEIDRETNLLATIFTPPELVEQRTFLVVPPEAAEWALSAGLPVPPEAYDVIQPPNPSPQARITSPRMLAYIHGEIIIKGSATGENFQYYRLQVGEGLNPRTWVQIGEDSSLPVENGVLGKWDTGSGEGLYILRLQVVGADQRVETDIIQVTVDNTPPWARILSPRPGDTYRYLATSGLSFEVEVEDAIGIRQVEWMVDDKVVAVKESAPYNMVWSTVRGTHTVQVRVTDLAGNVTESPAVSFTVE